MFFQNNLDTKQLIIEKIKNGALVNQICNEFNLDSNEIYEILKEAVYTDKSILFNSLSITIQIRLLMHIGNYDEASRICTLEINKNKENIQEIYVRLLLHLYSNSNDKQHLNTAYNICINRCGNNNFDKLRKKIIQYDNSFINDSSYLLTNIYYSEIAKEEIENSNLSDIEKVILLISYFEKTNKKNGLLYIKKLKVEYKDNISMIKVLNVLYNRLDGKKSKLFDPSIYTQYLLCEVNSELIKEDKYEEEKVVVKKEKVEPIKKQEKIVPKNITPVVPKYTTQVGVNRNSRYNNQNNIYSSNTEKVSNKNNTTNKIIYIKDIFSQEVLEIGSYLYIQMNKIENQHNAVKAWDNFECLINKTSDDNEAVDKMINMINKFRSAGIITSNNSYDKSKILNKNIK